MSRGYQYFERVTRSEDHVQLVRCWFEQNGHMRPWRELRVILFAPQPAVKSRGWVVSLAAWADDAELVKEFQLAHEKSVRWRKAIGTAEKASDNVGREDLCIEYAEAWIDSVGWRSPWVDVCTALFGFNGVLRDWCDDDDAHAHFFAHHGEARTREAP